MTSISRVYDPGLGRTRDPYPWELPAALRGPMEPRDTARAQRRAARDARERERRSGQTSRKGHQR